MDIDLSEWGKSRRREPSGRVQPEGTSGQELADGKNTLVLLDSSGSMVGPADGKTKLGAAKEAISNYVATTPRSVDRLGLAVYGHRGSRGEEGKAENCREVEVSRRSASFAGREEGQPGDPRVRRAEPCGGYPVQAARRLKSSGIDVSVDVVGFDIRSQVDVKRLRDVAEAGGGEYVDAKVSAARDRAVKTPLAERERRVDELGREIDEIDRRLER